MAIGLLYGEDYPEAVGLKTEEFVRRFAEKKGAVRCIDLIGFDITSAMAGEDINNVKGLLSFFLRGGKLVCNGAVKTAVRLLIELLNEWEAQIVEVR